MNERALDAVSISKVTGNHSPRSTMQMIRSAGTALVGIAVLAALASCASQDPFGLPDLGPRGASPTAGVYSSYGTGYGYPGGYRPGYGYGYPNGYRPGFGYGYADPYYAAQGPYPYAYGYGYDFNPYPRYVVVPCADHNRDGRCDTRLPEDHGHRSGGQGGDPDRADQPKRQRDARGLVPRVGNGGSQGVAPTVHPQAVPTPAPVVQQPARVRPESRRAIPPDATTPRDPRVGRGRPSMTGDDVVQSRPTQEP
jgi:hypothetical protein